MSVRSLRYWLATGLTPATFGRGPEGSNVLSFHDLVSLEIVRLFREEGVSLHKVRDLDARLRELYPHVVRPFAHQLFFTDGSAIWHQLNPSDTTVVEIIGRRPDQAAWKPVIRSFAREVRYEGGQAVSWQLHEAVEINPRIQFGVPVVAGTRIPVATVKVELEHASPGEVASWHGVDASLIEGVRSYISAAA